MKGTDRLKFRPRALPLTLCTFSFFCLLFLSPPAIDADEFTRTSRYAARLFSYGLLIVDTRMGDVRVTGLVSREQLRVNYGDVEIDVPDVYRLRSLDAHTWLGYVQSDLHGLPQDSAGFRRRLFFENSQGRQDILVRVRMGGVFVFGGPE